MIRILWFIALIILAFWLIGFILDIVGALIHVLLVVVVVIVIYNLVAGRKGTA